MAIKQRSLLGFAAPRAPKARASGGGGGGGSADITGTRLKDIITNQALAATPTGEFTDPEQIQATIDRLTPLIGTEYDKKGDIELAVYKLQADKAGLSTKIKNKQSDKAAFETTIKAKKNSVTGDNIGDILTLSGHYADIYQHAADSWEEQIYSGGKEPTQEDLNYLKELRQKAEDNFQVYYNGTPGASGVDTGDIGNLLSDQWMAAVDTDASGTITDVNIVPSSRVGDGDYKDYVRTSQKLQVGTGGVRMALRSSPDANEILKGEDGKLYNVNVARLGDIVYKSVDAGAPESIAGSYGRGYMAPQRVDEGGFLGGWKNDAAVQKNQFIDRTSGQNAAPINLKDAGFNFNSNAISPGQVVSVGTDIYYSNPKNGDLYKIGGDTVEDKMKNLRNYYIATGQDPNKLRPADRRTPDALYNPDGTLKVKTVINQDWFKPKDQNFIGPQPTYSMEQQSLMFRTPSASQSEPVQGPQLQTANTQVRNTPDKVDQQAMRKETVAGVPSANDIINKGMDFFKGAFKFGI